MNLSAYVIFIRQYETKWNYLMDNYTYKIILN